MTNAIKKNSRIKKSKERKGRIEKKRDSLLRGQSYHFFFVVANENFAEKIGA